MLGMTVWIIRGMLSQALNFADNMPFAEFRGCWGTKLLDMAAGPPWKYLFSLIFPCNLLANTAVLVNIHHMQAHDL